MSWSSPPLQEYGEEEVFLVVKEAATEEEAIALLRRDCELCAGVMTLQQVRKRWS